MEKLSTIQKSENHNEVYVNKKRDGYDYMIVKAGCAKYDDTNKLMIVSPEDVIKDINFQNETPSITEKDLLEIVRDRLNAACESNRDVFMALTHVEEALMWLSKNDEKIESKNRIRRV